MLTVNEPQAWTLIGVLAAAFAGTIAVTTQLMMRSFADQVGGLRTEMVLRFELMDQKSDARFLAVDGRFDRLETRIDGVETRLDRVEKRLDGIDADVQALTRRVMPD